MKRFLLSIISLILCSSLLFGCSGDENLGQTDTTVDLEVQGKDYISSSPAEPPENSSETSSEPQSSVVSSEPELEEGETLIGTTSKGFQIVQKDGKYYIDGLLIANKSYALPESYAPGSLYYKCSAAFEELKAAAKKDNISIWVSSGYRSYSRQKYLYENYCATDGVKNADTYSARPGHSEHQTGLAIDVNQADTEAFETTYKHVGEWLQENCWDYGFIIRYPKGKEHITGYIYEPWHIRWVGTEVSLKLKESGETLEEYLGIDSKYAS